MKAKKIFEDYGFEVELTRKDENGLYKNGNAGFKVEDMEERNNIIKKSKADLVISIHMNSFSSSSEKGAQVYYEKGDKVSENLAYSIQECFYNQLESAREFSNFGDYYLFNCNNIPTVIVECGFLTNSEDEALLLSEKYQEKIAYALLCGVVKTLKN